MDNVLQTTVYLKDLKEYPGMNEVYATFFSEPRPARATVQVAALLFGMKVEIQGIAHVPSEQRPRKAVRLARSVFPPSQKSQGQRPSPP